MSAGPGADSPEEAGRTLLRIVRGEPTPEELAALTALVTAAAAGGRGAPAAAPRRGRWSDPAHRHVRLPAPGPGAWAASYR